MCRVWQLTAPDSSPKTSQAVRVCPERATDTTSCMWPNSPPPLPELGFQGPVGLWDGGTFVTYEAASYPGWLDDARLSHPVTGSIQCCERWDREYQVGRGETYLELSQLDIDDVDAVLDYVSTFNVLDIRALDAQRLERQWYSVATPRSQPLRILRYYPGFGDVGPGRGSSLDSSLRDDVVARCQAQSDAAPTWVISETLEEFRWGARAISDLHAAWCCLRDGDDPRDIEWANPRMPRPDQSRNHAVAVVAGFLEQTVSDALQGFSPRMWLLDDAERRVFQMSPTPTTPEPANITMFEVLVLELFRHIVENAPFKNCQNPSCRRRFVRQEGGAVHGQSRMTGVMYCSRTCAKAVAQRRYRSRIAARHPKSRGASS